tara:strand:- start:1922 stop:2287 length:366 start_codon:yes stop_codon:yes gene_type:complete
MTERFIRKLTKCRALIPEQGSTLAEVQAVLGELSVEFINKVLMTVQVKYDRKAKRYYRYNQGYSLAERLDMVYNLDLSSPEFENTMRARPKGYKLGCKDHSDRIESILEDLYANEYNECDT